METELMSQREIALLARVSKPAVTAWRRRHTDFPAPVSGDHGQPLFPADAVVAWLLRTGLGHADPNTLRAEQSMHTLAAYARRHGGRRAVAVLGAALCLRHLAGRALPADPLPLARRLDPDDEFLLHELADAPEPAGLAPLVEQLIEGAFDAWHACRFLLSSANRLGWPELTADALAPELVALIRRVADVPTRLGARHAITIADGNAGTGDLLTALVSDLDRDNLRVTASVADEELARLVRRQLLLADLPEFQFDIRADELAEEFAEPDLIVTRLAYRPAETRDALTDLDRVEAITDLLGSGRTAIVVGPASSLVDELRDGAAVMRRAALLGTGIVEAIVRLPGGVFPARPGHPAALWLLTRDPVPTVKGRLLLADLSGTALDQATVDSAAEDILLWRAEGHRSDGHDPRIGRTVPLESLDLRRGAALRPPGPTSVALRARLAADRPALIGEVERRLTDAEQQSIRYAQEHGPLDTRSVQRDGSRPKELSLGALRTARRVRPLPGHRLSPGHAGPRGHHRVIGAEEVLAQSSNRWMDRLTLAAEYPHLALTEPGDLVVTTVPKFGVFLEEDGFSVIEFPARGLRISPGDPLTPRVLKALLDAARNTTRSPGAVRGPGLRDATVPDLPLNEAARLNEVLRRLEERERLLQRQAGLLAELRELAVTGFADGTLTTLYGTNS
ncbi:SAM-dependent DNA methyltransferase [Plantactinospora sp. KLBMP9567]|uniref:SAM-dependent DNA methyltransferase n=1 Tax=Plantactinospora sp. KLBMP9567 TaxID=3085900 RepID=UPI0029812278|nr:SAM-dependent DNA methyltransferase [Plantactinospora sp. KLBMP9567]MDW5330650.1 SAM-dependent DNA methyltransferase [Plantactinospora sp. KLBMP9567]